MGEGRSRGRSRSKVFLGQVKEYELSQVFTHPRLEYETEISSNDVLGTQINIRPLLLTPSLNEGRRTSAPSLSTIANYFSHLETKNTHKSKKRKLKRSRKCGRVMNLRAIESMD
jgi:hypothetical protein